MHFDSYLRLCLDCALVDDHCNVEAMKAIFERVKPVKLDYILAGEFENALLYIAKRKRATALAVFSQVARSAPSHAQSRLDTIGLVSTPDGKLCYTKRKMLHKVPCSIPPQEKLAYHFVPNLFLLEMNGESPMRNHGVFYRLSIEDQHIAQAHHYDLRVNGKHHLYGVPGSNGVDPLTEKLK
jgi:hypothetical protein